MSHEDLSRLRGLYAIVDPDQTNDRDPQEVAAAILRGGCAILQLRAKSLPDDAHLALARALGAMCHARGVPFVLNDRADLAVLAGADGVHLGQDDLSLDDARIVAPKLFVGRSTHDLDQLDAEAEADMLGFGPVFPTTTKDTKDAVVGVSLLARALTKTKKPLVAIGGITHATLAEVLRTGVRLVASISAITRADDIESSARTMHEAIVAAR